MAAQTFTATVLGVANFPQITTVNVRSGPGKAQHKLFELPVGSTAVIQDVKPDETGEQGTGKVYQWMQLVLPDGQTGWVRDDLIGVQGDGSRFGYGLVPQTVRAFELVRQAAAAPAAPTSTPATASPFTPATPAASAFTPAAPTATTSAGPARLIAMSKLGINVRPGPGSVHNPPLGKLPYLTVCEVHEVRAEDNNATRFRWIRMTGGGLSGWVREDFVRFDGDFETIGLGKRDAYPAPLANSWWVRDFDNMQGSSTYHLGWDFGAAVGEPVLAGPNGGVVHSLGRCTKCTPSQPSTVSQGLGLGNTAVFSDPAWGFGYGNYVVVRYLNEQLPESTRQLLANRGMSGSHMFVVYAHLNTIDTQPAKALAPNERIGTVGNTGNSEAEHLHLEIRAWPDANETSFGKMQRNILDPVLLFRR